MKGLFYVFLRRSRMSKEKRGFRKLVETIGEQFCREHQDTMLFSSEECEEGLYCFLGITLHEKNTPITLSASLDDLDIYATCYEQMMILY